MELAKFGRKSNLLDGFKNRIAFDLSKVSYMNIFAFANEKNGNKQQVALKFIIQGKEEMLYANSNDEITKLENIFSAWINRYTPVEQK